MISRGRGWFRWVIGGYCAGVVFLLLLLAPRLLQAREGLGFPPVLWLWGLPEAAFGIFFFTLLSFLVAVWVGRRRRMDWGNSLLIAVLGVAGYEFLYGVGFAVLQGRPGLLVPPAGLPPDGWSGFGTWILLEGIVASLVVYRYPHLAIDRWTILAATVFVSGMLAWQALYDLWFPPAANSTGVLAVNTITEVAGSLVVPLIASARDGTGPDSNNRIRHPEKNGKVPLTGGLERMVEAETVRNGESILPGRRRPDSVGGSHGRSDPRVLRVQLRVRCGSRTPLGSPVLTPETSTRRHGSSAITLPGDLAGTPVAPSPRGDPGRPSGRRPDVSPPPSSPTK